ncbi:MAG TPA: hypothetical protein VFI97_03585 [Arthrobacter sp.]|nr:hypothetical protein [Arthrobacter sp.]
MTQPYHVDTGTSAGLDTQHAAAIIVLLALALLILIRRGFRGVTVSGVGGIKVG